MVKKKISEENIASFLNQEMLDKSSQERSPDEKEKAHTTLRQFIGENRKKTTLLEKQIYEEIQVRQDLNGYSNRTLGYSELANKFNVTKRTIQRTINKLLVSNRIQRVEIINTKTLKGSVYKIC